MSSVLTEDLINSLLPKELLLRYLFYKFIWLVLFCAVYRSFVPHIICTDMVPYGPERLRQYKWC